MTAIFAALIATSGVGQSVSPATPTAGADTAPVFNVHMLDVGWTAPSAANSHALGFEAYPPISRRLSEQGRTALKLLVMPDGSVGDVIIEKSSGFHRLDEGAVVAVKKWRYHPATHDGKPAAVWLVSTLDWTMMCADVPEGHGFIVIRAKPEEFPPESAAADEIGSTMLMGIVSERGTIERWTLRSRSAHDRLDQASMAIAQRWHADPAVIAQNTYSGTVVMFVLWRLPTNDPRSSLFPYCQR